MSCPEAHADDGPLLQLRTQAHGGPRQVAQPYDLHGGAPGEGVGQEGACAQMQLSMQGIKELEEQTHEGVNGRMAAEGTSFGSVDLRTS